MISTRKRPWSREQWRAFGRRCRAVADELSELIDKFPATPGLTPSHINAIIRVYHRLFVAMLKAENVFVLQYPEAENEAIVTMHGSEPRSGWGSCRGRVPSNAPYLSRAEWTVWGKRVKGIDAEVRALMLSFQETARATQVHVRQFSKVNDAMMRVKMLFDTLVCRQHPDWERFTRVFYGPEDP